MFASFNLPGEKSSQSASSAVRTIIVEDEPAVLTTIAKLLEANNFQPEMFGSAADALETLSEQDSGCIITDIRMPGMSGIEFQAELVRRGSHLAVIVISGFADVPQAIEIMGRGAVTLLEKPFSPTQLINEVHRAIKFSKLSTERSVRRRDASNRLNKLSSQELNVLRLLSQGLSARSISKRSLMSSRDVSKLQTAAFEKLDLSSVDDFLTLESIARGDI